MQHPVFKNKKNLYTYLFAWIPVFGIHAFIAIYAYNLNPVLSIADAGLSTVLFALFGLLSWYTVRFISIDNNNILSNAGNHLIAAFVFIALWFFASTIALENISTDLPFLNFLKGTWLFRILIAFFLYCILALSYYLYKYYTSYKRRIEKEAEWKTLAKDGELNLLKSQLQPHFIFNSLNSIHSLLYQDIDKAQQMLSDLSAYLRLSIEKNTEKYVSLSEELQNGMLYYSIEKIRFGDRLHIQTIADQDTLDCKVPFMILQPLIENAVKHGLFGSFDKITIELNCFTEENMLHIVIKNNHDPAIRKQAGNGVGLKHTLHRFYLLFGRRDLVKIKDENGIFQVELIIPQVQH